METQENLLDRTNNLVYIKMRKDIAYSLMKNIENICKNFENFKNKAFINFILTESILYLCIKLEKLDNLFSFEIKLSDDLNIFNLNNFISNNNNNNEFSSQNNNCEFLIKLNIIRNYLKSLNFKSSKNMDLYLIFDDYNAEFITRVEYEKDNEIIIMESSLCRFYEMEYNDMNIDLEVLWSAELSANDLIYSLRLARENFLKDGNEGCNFNFLISHKGYYIYDYDKILQIRFYKTSEKNEMKIEVPFHERKVKKSYKNNIRNNTSNYEDEDNEGKDENDKKIDKSVLLEIFAENDLQNVAYDSKHILNFLNSFVFYENIFVLNYLNSKGIKLEIQVESCFKIIYIFPYKYEIN